jgi:hypothetical protein
MGLDTMKIGQHPRPYQPGIRSSIDPETMNE